ncbi:MAG: sigma-54 dependent transcriptional regulator [Planctomycetota bacterium]|nr:sigma-54 dependent transcriptional regulator [Planctomycetota bacterium]
MTQGNPTDAGAHLRILVVDDETIVRESLGGWLKEDGHDVTVADSASQALHVVAESTFDLALIDIKMPKMDGLELQERLAEAAPDLTVIIMTAYASVETAVNALKAGAYDYLVKPFDPDELSHLIRRAAEFRSLSDENARLRESLDAARVRSPIVGVSRAMRQVHDLIEDVAKTDATVLVRGESGTGKELVAHAIHEASGRRYNPLVIVHCGALAEGVLESELFGHEKGAFTGAQHHHKGKFEQADGGTIFLDEIGEISAKVQVELLRVLEEREVTRVGGKQAIATDFRVVAATNRDLQALVEEGTFREDLFYRLNVVPIVIPPLRDRPEDIPALAEHFLERVCSKMSRKVPTLTPDAVEVLRGHDWPGNGRELLNAVERAVVFCKQDALRPADFPHYVTGGEAAAPPARTLAGMERAHIVRMLDEADWNVSRAAAVLEIDRGTLYAKIRKYGLERPAAHEG